MKKSLFVLTVLVGLLLIDGCSSMGRGMMKTWMRNSPTYNWVYINTTTKVGAYTRFASEDEDYIMRYEMVSKKDGLFHMKVGFDKAHTMASYLKELEWHYLVTAKGFVKRAYLKDLSDGSETELTLSKEGDFGYITPKTTKLKKTETVETKVGTFKVNEVMVYNLLVHLGYGKSKVTYVNFINLKVPFGVVRQQETHATNLPVSDVFNFINAVNPAMAPNALLRFLIGKADDASYKRIWNLIEVGQRK